MNSNAVFRTSHRKPAERTILLCMYHVAIHGVLSLQVALKSHDMILIRQYVQIDRCLQFRETEQAVGSIDIK